MRLVAYNKGSNPTHSKIFHWEEPISLSLQGTELNIAGLQRDQGLKKVTDNSHSVVGFADPAVMGRQSSRMRVTHLISHVDDILIIPF